MYFETSDGIVETTVVRGTRSNGFGLGGGGIFAQHLEVGEPAHVTVRGSIVRDNAYVAVLSSESDVTVSSCWIRDTIPEGSGDFGDGMLAGAWSEQARLTVDGSRIERSARAGLSNFGSVVSIANTALLCAAFDLEGEPFNGLPFELADRGGNGCGCPEPAAACVARSHGLAPPPSLSPE